MPKYNAKMTCKIPGHIESEDPFVADDLQDLATQVADWCHSGGTDELKDWDNVDDYVVVSVTDADGKEVFTQEQLGAINQGSWPDLDPKGLPWLVDAPDIAKIGTVSEPALLWKNVHAAKTKADAVAWIRANISSHCDDDGKISLLSFEEGVL